MPTYVQGYVLYTMGLEAPMWYAQGGTVAVCTVGLRTRNSEFLLVMRSTADGLQETCRLLWMSIPTQMGFSHYTVLRSNHLLSAKKSMAWIQASPLQIHRIRAQTTPNHNAHESTPTRSGWIACRGPHIMCLPSCLYSFHSE